MSLSLTVLLLQLLTTTALEETWGFVGDDDELAPAGTAATCWLAPVLDAFALDCDVAETVAWLSLDVVVVVIVVVGAVEGVVDASLLLFWLAVGASFVADTRAAVVSVLVVVVDAGLELVNTVAFVAAIGELVPLFETPMLMPMLNYLVICVTKMYRKKYNKPSAWLNTVTNTITIGTTIILG